MISGLLTLPVLFLLGRRLADDRVGLVAAALYALIPFAVVHNGIGIMESLVTLVVATALLLQIDFARNPTIRLALLLGLVGAIGVLTKENTKPAMALLPLSLILFDWRPEGRRERLTRWVGGAAIVGAMMVLADRLMHVPRTSTSSSAGGGTASTRLASWATWSATRSAAGTRRSTPTARPSSSTSRSRCCWRRAWAR